MRNYLKLSESVGQTSLIACLLFSYIPVLILLFLGISCGISGRIILNDSFNKRYLDKNLWIITESGDFAEKAVNIYDLDISGKRNHVLRLKAGTKNTEVNTKTIGIRSRDKIDFTDGIEIEADIDWNDQKNGSYLSAVIMLSPDSVEDMESSSDFIALEYKGVPPGENIGVTLKRKFRRSLKVIYKDYGTADANGKFTGLNPDDNILHIRILIDDVNICFMENEYMKYKLSRHNLDFSSGFLYLQLRSGTNYAPREIYFDNVRITDAEI